MKNGLLVWNILLTLIVGYLVIDKFTGGKSARASRTETSITDSTGAPTDFRVAYFEMDTVAAKFEEVKLLKAELAKKEEDNNKELNNLTQQFRNRYEHYQGIAEKGEMTEAQSIAAQQELQQMEENIKNRKMALEQDYNAFYMQRQTDVKKKIEDYIRELNKDGKYTYVVSDDPGLFYFKDPRFNITNEVISGLNKLYPPKKSAKTDK